MSSLTRRLAIQWSAIQRRERELAVTGWACWVLVTVLLGASFTDQRTILGLDPWVKPSKFAASFAVYCWTMAWLFTRIEMSRRLRQFLRWGLVFFVVAELALISFQSARGVTSHFNVATALDRWIYEAMRDIVVFNTMIAVVVLVILWRQRHRFAPALSWGVRLGLVVFVLGSLEGIIMAVRGAHAVGVVDGGPGLPVVNWSLEGGDLRAAHFLGIHALQVLPLLGHLIDRLAKRLSWPQAALSPAMGGAALGYLGLVAWLVHRALRAIPLLPLGGFGS